MLGDQRPHAASELLCCTAGIAPGHLPPGPARPRPGGAGAVLRADLDDSELPVNAAGVPGVLPRKGPAPRLGQAQPCHYAGCVYFQVFLSVLGLRLLPKEMTALSVRGHLMDIERLLLDSEFTGSEVILGHKLQAHYTGEMWSL